MGPGKPQSLVCMSQGDPGPLWFSISVNDLHDETEPTLSRVAEEWLVDQKIVLFFTGTLSGWRNGQTRIS